MKTTYIIFLFTLAIGMTSCEKLLEIDAKGTVSGNIYTDTDNIQKALLGAYYSLGGISNGSEGGELFGGDFMIIPTLLAHRNGVEIRWVSNLAPPYADFIDKDILVTNLRVAANWRRAYEVINVCQNIIANIENVDDATERERILGEALAIRGILYFELVRLWAPQYDADGVTPGTDLAVPIIEQPLTEVDQIESATLSTIEEVYTQAETDLLEASTRLLAFGTNGTNLSYYACQAYLARLSLQKGLYLDAAEYAENVIESSAYSLVASPLEAFNNASNSAEDIFAIQQTLANSSGDRSTGTGVTAHYSSLTESGLGTFFINSGSFMDGALGNSLYYSARYSDNDLRGSVDLSANSNTTSDQISTGFYRSVVNDLDELVSSAKYMRADHVLPILRLAEMHLIRAEALNEEAGLNSVSIDDLNAIRTRAGLVAVSSADFTDADQFYDSLVVEKSREFLYEGVLLHDVRRWGGFFGFPGFNEDDSWDEKYILPIPQNELDASGLSTD